MHTQKILLIKKGYNSKLIFFQIFSQKKSKKLIKKIHIGGIKKKIFYYELEPKKKKLKTIKL